MSIKRQASWPKNYLPYFAWKGLGIENDYYQQKQSLLRSQKAKAKRRESNTIIGEKGLSAATAFAAESQIKLIDNEVMSFEKLLGLDQGDVTTGAKAGLGRSGSVSTGSTIGEAAGHITRSVNKRIDWLDKAINYSQALQRILDDIFKGLGPIKNATELSIMIKAIKKTQLTPDEQKIYNKIIRKYNGGFVRGNLKEMEKILELINTYEQNLANLNQMIEKKDINLDEQSGKTSLQSIARVSANVLRELGYRSAEAAAAHGYRSAIHKINPALKNLDSYIAGREALTVVYDQDYRRTFGEPLNNSNLNFVQRKGDVLVSGSEDDIEFQFGVSVKKTTQASIKKYGITIMTTSFALMLSRSGLLNNDDHLINVMKVASARPATNSYADSLLSEDQKDDILSEQSLAYYWKEIKELTAAAGILQYLAGGQEEIPPVICFVVNYKPFLISEVIEHLSQEISASRGKNHKLEVKGQNSSVTRSTYLEFNNFTSPLNRMSRAAGISRSQGLYSNLISTWKAQTISISLKNLNFLESI